MKVPLIIKNAHNSMIDLNRSCEKYTCALQQPWQIVIETTKAGLIHSQQGSSTYPTLARHPIRVRGTRLTTKPPRSFKLVSLQPGETPNAYVKF